MTAARQDVLGQRPVYTLPENTFARTTHPRPLGIGDGKAIKIASRVYQRVEQVGPHAFWVWGAGQAYYLVSLEANGPSGPPISVFGCTCQATGGERSRLTKGGETIFIHTTDAEGCNHILAAMLDSGWIDETEAQEIIDGGRTLERYMKRLNGPRAH